MPEIRAGSYARHPDLGTVKVIAIGHVADVQLGTVKVIAIGHVADVQDDCGGSYLVPVGDLTLDPIDAAEQAGEDA